MVTEKSSDSREKKDYKKPTGNKSFGDKKSFHKKDKSKGRDDDKFKRGDKKGTKKIPAFAGIKFC